MPDSKNGDRIMEAITMTQKMLARPQSGLISGEPMENLEKLAKETSMSALAIEVMVSGRWGKPFGSPLDSTEPKPAWLV